MSLRERRDIVELCSTAAEAAGVLFSVVGVKGSSYRQPGARMVALHDGRTAGTISGGCLEADLLRRAAWTVRNGAVVEQFSTAFDDTSDVPYGLGCGGEISVLAEPLATPEADALHAALAVSLRGEARVLATLFADAGQQNAAGLRRVVLDSERNVVFASESLSTEEIVALRDRMLRTAQEQTPMESGVWSGCSLLIEVLPPVQRLLIFGAGEDARPLARLAIEMGWQPVVIDTRVQRLGAARFPGAQCMQAARASDVPVLARDAVILMTHSYPHDRALLTELLTCPTAYLGLLGARHRSALLLSEAAETAGIPLEDAIAQTHAPVGLDLGGEGPEAVALAIVAEVQQVLAQRTSCGQRRLRTADIAGLLAERPELSYAACALTQAPSNESQVTQ